MSPGNFKELVNLVINSVFDPLNALLITAALVVFLWGVVKYIRSAGDEAARQEGKNFMIWGVIGLFVMVTVWGLVHLLENTFLLDNTPFPPPTLPGS